MSASQGSLFRPRFRVSGEPSYVKLRPSGRSSSRCDLETCTSVCFLPDVVRSEGAAGHAAFHIAAAALALAGVAASLGLARYLCKKRTAVVNR